MVRAPNYCASKAALHHFILVLREQLRGSKVKIVELFPPAVQSKPYPYAAPCAIPLRSGPAELYDEKHQPDIKNGRQIGMPLKQFTDEAYQELAEGKEEVLVGESRDWYEAFEGERQKLFRGMVSVKNKRN